MTGDPIAFAATYVSRSHGNNPYPDACGQIRSIPQPPSL